MADKTFVGFSTNDDDIRIGRSWALYDIELVIRDLLNHFHTRKGERIMRPEYGCSIWDWIMEPMSLSIQDQVDAEIRRICALDSRVLVNDVTVQGIDNGIIALATLTFLPSRTVQQLTVTFDSRQEF